MHIPLLADVVIIFALAVVVLLVCHYLRIPTVIGLLATGAIAGPYGFRFISEVANVEVLAEIGVILLLFTIGLEFSLRDLLKMKRVVLLGGVLQVVLTIGASIALAATNGASLKTAIFIGFLVSLSSTAIVLKDFQERSAVESPQGKAALAVLIFQDIAVVPMMIATPILSGNSSPEPMEILKLVAQAVGVVALVLLAARSIVPKLLYYIARIRSRELFLLCVVVICFAVAWLTSSIGLSLALGAFLAGLIISESEYSYQALSSILPFRDIFTSFFFVSIGMLLNVRIVFAEPLAIGSLVIVVFAVKLATGVIALRIAGFSFRPALLAGLAVCQIGEFSFILSQSGVETGLLSQEMYQIFLAVTIITMAATPFILRIAPSATQRVMNNTLVRRLMIRNVDEEAAPVQEELRDHLIVIGFGPSGRHLVQAARVAHIPYTIIEMNAETVETERGKGEPIFYGDASQDYILEHVKIKHARVVVIAISDLFATRQAVQMARYLNPNVHIIARTRFLHEEQALYDLGANEVIPEELEASIEIFSRVLVKYFVPQDDLAQLIAEVRADKYKMLRSNDLPSTTFPDVRSYLSDMDITTVRIKQKAMVLGKTLDEIGLRRDYGVTLLAIRRGAELVANPGADTALENNDILVLFGEPENVARVAELVARREGTSGLKKLLRR